MRRALSKKQKQIIIYTSVSLGFFCAYASIVLWFWAGSSFANTPLGFIVTFPISSVFRVIWLSAIVLRYIASEDAANGLFALGSFVLAPALSLAVGPLLGWLVGRLILWVFDRRNSAEQV